MCYVCGKLIAKIIYPNLESAMRSVPCDRSLHITIYSRENDNSFTSNVDIVLEESKQKSEDYEPEDYSEPLRFNQFELNDLMRYFCLPKNKQINKRHSPN